MKHKRRWIVLPLFVSLVLFIIPFFWLPSGFVDLGGDSGRLYFIDPLALARNLFMRQNVALAPSYAALPHYLFMALLGQIFLSPTLRIAADHGMQLGLAFFSMYLVVSELMSWSERGKYVTWTTLVSALVYVGFITKTGWVTSLQTQNQAFLNPLLFYFLMKYVVSKHFRYALSIIAVTILYSFNFGYSSMPQLLSFFPLAMLYLWAYVRFIAKLRIPWKKLALLVVLFFSLHAFHLVPMVGSLIDPGNPVNDRVFSNTARLNDGLYYFDANRPNLGKLSVELFQPNKWNGQTLMILIVPLVAFIGFLKKRSKLLALTGAFFALTFYLVTANITLLGVKLYRMLFYLPGFLMFRSFDEKWYWVYIFFFTILFSVSFQALAAGWKKAAVALLGCVVLVGIGVRIWPFLRGEFYATMLYESNNVSPVFSPDPDVESAISFVRKLPPDGHVLTIPLTLPYYQVVNGRRGGAYVGVSMVYFLTDKEDIAGFWRFGPHQKVAIETFREGNASHILQLLSLFSVHYIFRDTDPSIFTNFPRYPFYKYDMTVDIPTIDSQNSYDALLAQLPLNPLFTQGYFQVSAIDDKFVRPLIYVPDQTESSLTAVLAGPSYRSAYLTPETCQSISRAFCDGTAMTRVPKLSFTRLSPWEYHVTADLQGITKPFLVVLSEDYHSSWRLMLSGESQVNNRHILVNGYANGWVIDPSSLQSGRLDGSIRLGFQTYFVVGRWITVITAASMLCLLFINFIRKRYDKT